LDETGPRCAGPRGAPRVSSARGAARFRRARPRGFRRATPPGDGVDAGGNAEAG